MSTLSPSSDQAPVPHPLREAAAAWFRHDGPAWIFVFKTLIAGFLALWIGFRLDLDGAKSAMLTVFIVAQSHSGNVVAKSFYRVLGTLVGLLVTVAFVQIFGQTRDLFIVAVCLWVGLCVTGAAYFRNFQSYAFLLAGYTSCLIGFPAVQHAEATFDIALSRATAVLLGILCAGVVAEAILPQRLSNLMVPMVRGRYRDFVAFARNALTGKLDHAAIQQAHNRFTADVLALETQRAAAYFEDAETRIRDNRLRLFNAEFMAASTSLHALHQWMERMRREDRQRVLKCFAPIYGLLDEALAYGDRLPEMAVEAREVSAQLNAVRPQLEQMIATARVAIHHGDQHLHHSVDDRAAIGTESNHHAENERDYADFDCAADLLLRFATTLAEYTEAYGSLADAGASAPRHAPRLLPHTDPLVAALMGLRTSVTLLILCGFWIATAWPNGAGVATIATVVCALFAQAPAPLVAASQMSMGFAIGLLAAFVCAFGLLPLIDNFPLLVAAMAPFLMASTWATTMPKFAGIGTGFNIMFLVEMGPENIERANALTVVNDGLSQLLGVVVAGIAFSTLLPTSVQWLRQRRLAALRDQVALASVAPLPGLGHRIESHTRDLLVQLLVGINPAGDENRQLTATALATLEISDALIIARQHSRAAGLDGLSRRGLRHAARKIGQYCSQPTPVALRRALAALDHAAHRLAAVEDSTSRDPVELAALQALRRGLYRLRRALLDPDTAAAPVAADIQGLMENR